MTVRVNYQTTAVIDVDPEKGFSELCPNELPVAGALDIVPELLKNHAKGRLKLVSRDLHPPKAAWDAETPANMLEPVGLPNVDVKWNRHCVLGTTGVELLDGLPPVLDYDFQVSVFALFILKRFQHFRLAINLCKRLQVESGFVAQIGRTFRLIQVFRYTNFALNQRPHQGRVTTLVL